MRSSQKAKAGRRPPPSKTQIDKNPDRVPGQSARRSTRAEALLLGLRLFRLLSLLRFLSHSILSGFNGWNATPRHALWRRANLATSSQPFPPDSRAAAAHCHDAIMALSTADMRFGGHFLKFSGVAVTRVRDATAKSARQQG